jgi:subtilisin family serine protease
MNRHLLALLMLAAALPLQAERVRAIVAVQAPAYSIASAGELRHRILATLDTASRAESWGASGSAFSVEVDESELEKLRRDPLVAAVTIDSGGEGAMLESARLVGADQLHAQGLDGRGVTVAILDTGIDRDNPDFAGRVVAEQCFCDNMDGTGCCPGGMRMQSGPGAARDDHGHGTHVAGVLAGGGVYAPRGIAPRANIVAVKVMDAHNSYRSATQIYRALEWITVARPDVQVINMSLGSRSLFGSETCNASALALGMHEVVELLRLRGVLITASSGNSGSISSTTFPACMGPIVGVGATYDSDGAHSIYCTVTDARVDDVACFSNSDSSVDLMAPGAAITSSKRGGGTIINGGTSMAAPHVAGTIALMKQASGALLTAYELEAILRNTGTLVFDPRNYLTFSRLNAAAALAATPRVEPVPRRRAVRH